MRQAAPAAALVVAEAEFLLRVQIVALDPPAQLAEADPLGEGHVRGEVGEPEFGRRRRSLGPCDRSQGSGRGSRRWSSAKVTWRAARPAWRRRSWGGRPRPDQGLGGDRCHAVGPDGGMGRLADAVLLAELAAVLPCHADRMPALLGQTRVGEDPGLDAALGLERRRHLAPNGREQGLVRPRRLGDAGRRRPVRRTDPRRQRLAATLEPTLASVAHGQPRSAIPRKQLGEKSSDIVRVYDTVGLGGRSTVLQRWRLDVEAKAWRLVSACAIGGPAMAASGRAPNRA